MNNRGWIPAGARSFEAVGSSNVNRPMTRTSARLAAIAPSATLAVDSKAKAMKAAGENVIGFGAGEPDFPTPQHIVDAAIAACADPKNHKYSPAGGLPELKQAICDKTLRDSGFASEPANVLVTCGGKHAVYTAFAALCDPGDEVLCPAPYWTTQRRSRSPVAFRSSSTPTPSRVSRSRLRSSTPPRPTRPRCSSS